jgi:hypothetical protein
MATLGWAVTEIGYRITFERIRHEVKRYVFW